MTCESTLISVKKYLTDQWLAQLPLNFRAATSVAKI